MNSDLSVLVSSILVGAGAYGIGWVIGIEKGWRRAIAKFRRAESNGKTLKEALDAEDKDA